MKGRQIKDQTELINMMINMCEVEEVNGAIVCLDQEKASDKISHDFLFRSLAKFGFPKHFIDTVQALYHEAYTVVIINGEVSSPFKITRGVRQGDPLSCLLFNIAIESLAMMLRESNLSGLRINGEVERTIAMLFADDTTVYLTNSDSFEDLHNILRKWCCASKAKFNVQKTEIIPVGSEAYRTEVAENRKLSSSHPEIPSQIHIAKDGEPIRVLRAFVGNKVNQVNVWTPILEKTESALARWESTRPTQDGKRLIVNMVVGGYTQYLARVQGMPKEVEKLFTKKIRDLMSGGEKVPMIGLPVLHGKIECGGKKLLNIEARNQAIELMKLKSYLAIGSERPKWANVADILIAKNITAGCRVTDELSISNVFLQSWRVNKTKAKSTLPERLHKMLRTADKFHVTFNPTVLDVGLKRELPIWHHLGLDDKQVRNNGQREVCLRHNHGIISVGDLESFVARVMPGDHRSTKKCKCERCTMDHLSECALPYSCKLAALKLIDKLPPKWDPRILENQSASYPRDADPSEDDTVNNGALITFNPDMTTRGCLAQGFRVFASPEREPRLPAI